ncbi:MAG: hypothetical protein KJ578_07125 [Bacteroidetes bacterium]|nr:hypothetical protein [Bacteroidota bacterium]MBU1581025.1 hypothetical protein [Bacteroidota bacterium]MBU2464996.1 hypothetical protein [Bacteroidota bacterium]MBU2557533.1 hypothetical protein [Bacteroidota bacterium]
MPNHLQHLIENLETAAKNPPKRPFIKLPPQFEDWPELAELALPPYRYIEEWTGIQQRASPALIDLSCEEWPAMNVAFEAINIPRVDAPPKLPYSDIAVQYLPEVGFDLELCTHYPENRLTEKNNWKNVNIALNRSLNTVYQMINTLKN